MVHLLVDLFRVDPSANRKVGGEGPRIKETTKYNIQKDNYLNIDINLILFDLEINTDVFNIEKPAETTINRIRLATSSVMSVVVLLILKHFLIRRTYDTEVYQNSDASKNGSLTRIGRTVTERRNSDEYQKIHQDIPIGPSSTSTF